MERHAHLGPAITVVARNHRAHREIWPPFLHESLSLIVRPRSGRRSW